MASTPDYYDTLGILRDATQEEVKKAYLESAQRLHPDKNQAPGETEFFLVVQQAYETLSNPKRRKAYDATLPPQEDDPTNPIAIEIIYSRPQLVRMNDPQLIYALVNLRGRRRGDSLPVPPLNICLALDRSTSMKGAKMDLLKAAAIQFLRDMRNEDIFSVVTFSDRAEVAIAAGFQSERMKLESRIRDIQASGATELFQGLECGLNEVRRARDTRRVNHLILLTDGHTYGDEENCLQSAAKASKDGIGISVMGIGSDWNDIFLDQVASRTGNSSRYIAHPQEIQKLLAQKFSELTRMLAEETTLQFQLPEGVRLNYAFRMQPDSGPLEVEETAKLGPILRDGDTSVLFEFYVEPQALGVESALLLDGSLKVSMATRPTPLTPIRVRFQCDVADEPATTPPPSAIIKALSKLTLYRMQERARNESQSGNYDKATRSLKNLAVHLLEQGHSDLANTVLLEVESMQRRHTFSLSGEKDIKYATRALMNLGDFSL